jgi:hypothetical protein
MPEATMTFDELDNPPKASGGATMTFDQLDQPEAKAAPFWSWERIKKALSPQGMSEQLAAEYGGESSPETAREANKLFKNVGIGIGEAGTGLGEMLPNALGGGYAAKGTQWLESHADPEYWLAKEAGMGGAMLAGGEAAGMGKLLGGGSSFLGSVGRGALAGGGTGALAPTGKEDTSERYKDKGEDAALGAATGGAIGTLPPVARGVRSIYDKATGKEANEAAETVRAKVAGEAASASAKAADDLKMTLGPASSADEAMLIAQNKQNEAEAVRAGADYLAQMFANTPTLDQAAIGKQIREVAAAAFEKGDQTRKEQSGIQAIVDSYGKEPIVDVSRIRKYIKEESEKVAKGGESSETLKSFKSKMVPPRVARPASPTNHAATDAFSAFEQSAEEKMDAYLNQTKGRLPLSVADDFRQELRKTMMLKARSVEAGYKPLDGKQLAFVNKMYADLLKSIDDVAPEYGAALERFKRLSRPLDWLENEGPLAGALKEAQLSGEYTKFEGAIIKELVSKARLGDTSFAKLLAADPALKDSARAYFAGELFGRGPAQGAVSAGQFAKFLAENKRALDQLGLYGEFADKQTAQKTAGDLAERMKGEAEAATDTAKKAKGLEELETKYTALVNTLTKTDLPADEVTKTVEPFLTKLRADGFITEDQRADLQKQIHYIEKSYRTNAEFKRHAVNWLRYGVGGLIGAAGIEGLRRFWF